MSYGGGGGFTTPRETPDGGGGGGYAGDAGDQYRTPGAAASRDGPADRLVSPPGAAHARGSRRGTRGGAGGTRGSAGDGALH